jgi:WD40 repeat protein
MTVLLLLITILTGWVITSRQQNRQLQAQRLYAQSLVSQDSIDDRKFLLWAEKLSEIPEARFGLFMNYSPIRQRIIPESGGWVYSMAISPDRNWLATGREHGLVNLWDTNTMQIAYTLHGPDAVVHHVEFGPKGDLLAASFDNDPEASIYVWQIPDGKLLFSIDTQARWAKSIAFHPEKPLMAISLDSRDEIEILDISRLEQPVITLRPHGRAASIAFSPSGDLLAAGLMGPSENTILLWDTTNWEVNCEFSESKDWIFSLDFDNTGRVLASGGRARQLNLWDPQACKFVGVLEGHTDSIQSVSFSPDGTLLVSSGFDNVVRVWNIQEQKEVGSPLRGHKFIVQNAVFGKDNNTIFSGSLDKSIIVWDLKQTNSFEKKILGDEGSVVNLSVDKAGKILVALTNDGRTHIWNTSNYQRISIPREFENLTGKRVALSPDGQFVALLDATNLYVLQMETSTMTMVLRMEENFAVNSMSFTADSNQVILAGNFNKMIVFDLNTRRVREISGLGSDQSIDIRAIALSPNGNYLATGTTRGEITLWDAHRLERISGPIKAHRDWITQLAFSPDSKKLASASYDGIIILRDVATFEQIGSPFNGHKSHVFALAFSPDQLSLISGGADKSIIWWNLDTHMMIGKFNTSDSSPVTHLTFGADHQSIVSGSAAGNIFLWRIDSDQLIFFACEIAGRNLTNAEWEQFFPQEPYHRTCSQWPLEPEVAPISTP